MKKVFAFVKKETVLTIAWVLAVVSAFFVTPNKHYIDYIDFRSLGILWSLMVIMAGLQRNGVFEAVGKKLLLKTKRVWQLVFVLVFLCFVFSMFITNDVALITFVPFAIYMLEECQKVKLMIPVIVLQTLAANLGSMLTPIGNPQNLYLYGISGLGADEFLLLMLPYTLMTVVLLVLSILFIKGKGDAVQDVTEAHEGQSESKSRIYARIFVYAALFVLALIVVARIVPYWILALCVLVLVLLMDWKAVVSVDYALLFTFVGFFIFTGNLGQIPAINQFLTNLVSGREVLTGVLSSQVISNVPAALLLSNFTDNYNSLIVGVNLGGLGTLIASMASLISFKLLAHKHNELKGRYFILFTLANIAYLIILLALAMLLGEI